MRQLLGARSDESIDGAVRRILSANAPPSPARAAARIVFNGVGDPLEVLRRAAQVAHA